MTKKKPPARTCTRKLEFDAAHRVMEHESKCRNLHGHRYVVELTALAEGLDGLGRVIDFSVLKGVVGKWIDDNWDHGFIGHVQDTSLNEYVSDAGWKLYTMPANPTAENMASYLFTKANALLESYGVRIAHVRIYETPNCWADFGWADKKREDESTYPPINLERERGATTTTGVPE